MNVLHNLLVIGVNGAVAVGTFAIRETVVGVGLVCALAFARYEIREHAELNQGVGLDEPLL